MEQRFIKIRSTKNIITSLAFIIAGILLVLLPTDVGANMAGYTLIIIGIILARILKSDYYDTQSNERYCKQELYFDSAQKSALLKAIVSNPRQINSASESEGQALRLDLYFSHKAERATLQLFEYIPHEYIPCTEMYNYDIAEIKQLINR